MNLKCGAEGLGRACQSLIGHGRFEYMRKELLDNDGRVSFSHYADKTLLHKTQCCLVLLKSVKSKIQIKIIKSLEPLSFFILV